MLSRHLPPEQTDQVLIADLELLLGHDRSIVPRPPQNDRVESINAFLLREELTPLYYLPHCLHMAVDSLFTWSYDRLKTKGVSIARSGVRFSHGELSNGVG